MFGWQPWDLAYHLAWMAAAALQVLYMTASAVWPELPDDHDRAR